jgi:hypothetical protein
MRLLFRLVSAGAVAALFVWLANSPDWWPHHDLRVHQDGWLETPESRAGAFFAVSIDFLILSLFVERIWKLATVIFAAFAGPIFTLLLGLVWNLGIFAFGGDFSTDSIDEFMRVGLEFQVAFYLISFLYLLWVITAMIKVWAGPSESPRTILDELPFLRRIKRFKFGWGSAIVEMELDRIEAEKLSQKNHEVV